MDKPKSAKAAPHNLARLVYLMLSRAENHVDRGQQYHAERYRERVVRDLATKAAELGMQLTPAASPA